MYYSIGQISEIVKISNDTLRYYDEINLLKPHHVDNETHYRYYSKEQVSDLLFILELKQYGFSLDAIKQLLQCKDQDSLKEAFNTRLKQLSIDFEEIQKVINLLKKRIDELEEKNGENVDKKKILIVDDAAFMRMMLKDILKKNGYNVSGESVDGQNAVEKYFELKPDIVTMDITMPVMDGISAVKIIKEKDKDAKIIMLSAMSQASMVLDSLKAGACDFVVKPFRADSIVESIDKNLKEAGSYNLNTINMLLENNIFMERPEKAKNKVLSQQGVNMLLNICRKECTIDSPEVIEFLDMFEERKPKVEVKFTGEDALSSEQGAELIKNAKFEE